MKFLVLLSVLFVNAQVIAQDLTGTKIGFLADIHLHDIHAKIEKISKAELPQNATPLLIRSMNAQLSSTRLFNENYFVLKTALDDLVEKNVKLVALPGDLTDDGQPINVKAVSKILDEYTQKYGMRFFAITGNHDPVRPNTIAGGKSDFLSADGSEIAIHSLNHKKCNTPEITKNQHCSNALLQWGYKEIMDNMGQHGFYPQQQDIYYETPFTVKNTKQEKTTKGIQHQNESFENRQLIWCDPNNTKKCVNMPDASYLVEPIEGLWLLAIDANVYTPLYSTNKPTTYNGSSNAGYNQMLIYKKPVLAWIKDVAQRAKLQNKKLIAFSHYPATDFYDNTATDIAELFGKNKLQLKRMPTQETEDVLANMGLTLHFAGHMHINDTGVIKRKKNTSFYNIQIPSLAAYRPAYKLLTFDSKNNVQVDTITLDKVKNFQTLFPFYETEWQYRKQHNLPNWNKDILLSENYLEFTDQHLQQVVLQRFFIKDWPQDLVKHIQSNTLHTLLKPMLTTMTDNTLATETNKKLLSEKGEELAFDFYRIRSADSISKLTMSDEFYLSLNASKLTQGCRISNDTQCKLGRLVNIMQKMLRGEKSDSLSTAL